MYNPSFLIVTTMKNEGAFMLEWIAYNRSIGFTDFLIFTNDCLDGTEKIADRLEELGIAVHVANKLKPGQSPQRKALRKAWHHPKVKAAEWLFCADVDEFLNVRLEGGSVSDLIERVGDADAVSVCWKLFGNSGRKEYELGFVTEQFLFAAPEYTYPNFRARGVKTLFRNNGKFRRFGIHRPRVFEDSPALKWVDAGGQPMTRNFVSSGWSAQQGFSHEYARLHHYAVRSVDSFLVKRERGRTNHVNGDQGLEYWISMNVNQHQDRSILTKLSPAKAEYDQLLSDPKLASLHDAACQWHHNRSFQLKSHHDWVNFRNQIANETGGYPLFQGKADAEG